MSSKVKDLIYLDQDLLNSALSQIDEGLITSVKSTETDSESSGTNSQITGEIGIQAGVKSSINSRFTTNSNVSSAASEMIDTAFHDFALDLLIDKLSDKLQTDESKAKSGEFVLFNNAFNILNFNFLKTLTEENIFPDTVKFMNDLINKPQIQELRKEKNKLPVANKHIFDTKIAELQDEINNEKSARNGFKMLNKLSVVGDALYPNTTIFTSGASFLLAQNSELRISESQLSGLANTERKLHILGIVTDKRKIDEIDFDNFSVNTFSKLPDFLANSVFSDLVQENQNIVKPIAIYFLN
ncbi:DUF6414 family protein [Leuconostoc mesenteroides]|uniref:DUF6414 family protein n=1 Tax=Leuconostoc mesenteroides TaxID=1245 RepID=UPI0023604AE2|nr:hypothetical protein [Leuconostoc mesenteroides]